MVSNYYIGQNVKILNLGGIYPTYKHMFKKLNFYNLTFNYGYDRHKKDLTFKIFNLSKHRNENKLLLLAIRNSKGEELLIGSEYVKSIDSIYEIY